MVIIINAGRDSGVVVVPLASGDHTVSVFVSEAGEEFEEDFVVSHFSADHLWVHGGVINWLQVGSGDLSTSVVVEFQEGLVDQGLSLCVQLASDSYQELVVVNASVLVGVQASQKGLYTVSYE